MKSWFTLPVAVAIAAFAAVAHSQTPLPMPGPAAASAVLPRIDVRRGQLEIARLASSRLSAIRALGFEEGGMCVAPTPISETSVDPHRSLFVHDAATLNAGNFSLQRTLQKLSDDVVASVPSVTPQAIFRQLWDTQNDSGSAVTASNPHCSDNNGKIGAYPFNKCPRAEGDQAQGTDADVVTRLGEYRPVALVNRLDLADAGWKNCGEHRIVYGKGGLGISKNFIIFEAVLPNPKPGCRSGCRDVIEFWSGFSSDPSPASRAAKLEAFYYAGLPGFRPVVHTSHYSSGVASVYGASGSGQIRTNQFLSNAAAGQGPWTLKEFKTLLSCAGGVCDYDLMPVNVKSNPYGVLWSKDVANGGTPTAPPNNPHATPITGLSALAAAFQSEVLAQVTLDRLGNPDINSITFEVRPDKNAAESQSQGPPIDHYANQFNSSTDAGFKTSLNAVAGSVGLTGVQIVNRAMANSCAGCHLPTAFGLTSANSIGPGKSWPAALNFVHVDVASQVFGPADGFDPGQFGGNANGFSISPALLGTFLPARRTVLATNANESVCDCVRKPGLLVSDRLSRFKEILTRSRVGVRAQLDAVQKSTLAKSDVSAEDQRRFLAESKAVVTRAESARNEEFRRLGIAFAEPDLKSIPVMLSGERLSGASLTAAKLAAAQQMATAEPPRQSITGSFRVH